MKRSGSDRLIYVAFTANLIIAASKFTAALFTGSAAMLSEGVHSVVDTADQVLLLVGKRKSGKAPDAKHPFGYGMEAYFWSLMVAVLLFCLGGGVSVYQGVSRIMEPRPLEHMAWNYAVLAVALFSEGVSFRTAFKAFLSKRGPRGLWEAYHASKNPEIFVILAEDFAALAGIAIAFTCLSLGRILDMPRLDGIGSVLIGILLGLVAAVLVYELRELLLGESAGGRISRRIRAIAAENGALGESGQPLTMHFGPNQILLNMKLRFKGGLTLANVSETVARIKGRIRREFPGIKRIFIETPASRRRPRR